MLTIHQSDLATINELPKFNANEQLNWLSRSLDSLIQDTSLEIDSYKSMNGKGDGIEGFLKETLFVGQILITRPNDINFTNIFTLISKINSIFNSSHSIISSEEVKERLTLLLFAATSAQSKKLEEIEFEKLQGLENLATEEN